VTAPHPKIEIKVDLTNPGQFFACCGLLELADRLWPGALGRFDADVFWITSAGVLSELLGAICDAELQQLKADNDTASPIRLGDPFDLFLDWWNDELANGKALKVWAGSMRSVRIARAMQQAIRGVPDPTNLFDYCTVVYDPLNQRKKVEPFYFDSRRGRNAQSLDVGFAPDSLEMTTVASPAVEFLCLVGLQRFRPAPTDRRRVFDYFPWHAELPVEVAPAAASGALRCASRNRCRFENAFRTDQRKHKSFLPATPIGEKE